MDPVTGNPLEKEKLGRLSLLRLFFLFFIFLPIGLSAAVYPIVSFSIRAPLGLIVSEKRLKQASLSPPIFVKDVLDGDTIKLATGELVRYIGIDAPEVRKRIKGRWHIINEPFSKEASKLNQKLVGGREVQLELDSEHRDRYGRLLAYVYTREHETDELTFVNAELLRAGLARVMIRLPNDHYAELFYSIEQEARTARRALWKDL